MQGGAETGFRHVTAKEYKTRLFHFHGSRKEVKVVEVKFLVPDTNVMSYLVNHYLQIPLKKSLLNSGDVYVLDMGLQIFQWNGQNCNKDEKWRVNFHFH